MRVIDPGHEYELDAIDGEQANRLVFVKREGPGYPGNVGSHPGTTMQEVLRALIDRAGYVNDQIPCEETSTALLLMADALWQMEWRAAQRHGREQAFLKIPQYVVVAGTNKCPKCGHVGCVGNCRHAQGDGHDPGQDA